MKYCPYCGAELISGNASFCTECGKNIANESQNHNPEEHDHLTEKKSRQYDKKKEPISRRDKTKKKKKRESSSEQSDQPRNVDYDGYYDDVLPADIDKSHGGLDKDLLKKVLIVTGVVLVIISLCVIALYFL